MSTGIEFATNTILCQPDNKRLFFRLHSENKVFDYDIHCVFAMGSRKIHFYFSMSTTTVLIVLPLSSEQVYKCAKMLFHVGIDDRPVIAVHWLVDHERYIDGIVEDFREKHASYLFDQQINS